MPDSSPSRVTFWNSTELVDWMTAFSITAFSLIVLAYVGLIPLGHWAPDEYATLGEYSRDGWSALAKRLVEWSPRPFSELLLFAYAKSVAYYKAPLIEYALGALWLVLGTSLLAVPMSLNGEAASGKLRRQATAIALGLFCLLLLAHPIAETFYWPQSAVAYLPVISGVCITAWCFVLLGTSSKKARYAVSVALCIAALSAEVGAMFVAVLCSLVIAFLLQQWLLKGATPKRAQDLAFVLLPCVLAIGVLVAALLGRIEDSGVILGDPNIAHHVIPALTESVKRYPLELLSLNGSGLQLKHLIVGFVAKTSFLVGAHGMLLPIVATRKVSRHDRPLLALLSLACFVTAFVVLASAFHQFGSACCERHGTFRQALFFLGLFSLAGLLAGLRVAPVAGHLRNLTTARSLLLLGTSIAIPAMYSARAVASDYKNFVSHRQVQIATWESGLAPGEHFVFGIPPNGSVYGGLGFADGTHTVADDSGWMIAAILTYFNKDSVTFSRVRKDQADK